MCVKIIKNNSWKDIQMKAILTILLFCIVLFFYLHIHFQLKVSNDLEVFELDNPTFSKVKLEELCDLRQPVLFDFPEDIILQNCNHSLLLSQFQTFEVNVRENKNQSAKKKTSETSDENILPLPLHDAIELFKKDDDNVYFSENNSSFLEETGIAKKIQQNDKYIRPPMTSKVSYDILTGGNTPLRYDISYRNYFVLASGQVRIKLFPPKSTYYLYETKDYENFEFFSPMNCWNIQPEYQKDFDKVKCVDVELSVPGKAIYIPAYWWYSIQFIGENSLVVNCKYKTYMNIISVLPHIGLYFLQNQNIVAKTKTQTNKKRDIEIEKREIEKGEKRDIETKEET